LLSSFLYSRQRCCVRSHLAALRQYRLFKFNFAKNCNEISLMLSFRQLSTAELRIKPEFLKRRFLHETDVEKPVPASAGNASDRLRLELLQYSAGSLREKGQGAWRRPDFSGCRVGNPPS